MDGKNDRIIVGVAIGESYERQAQVMLESFLRNNGGWDAKIYLGNEIDGLLPRQFHNETPFNKSEVGRWCAIRKALQDGYKTALYCDNDIFFYGKYEPLGNALVLFPHYVTDKAKRIGAHWLIQDGVPNLGMFEASGLEGAEICTIVIDEVSRNPRAFMHPNGSVIWLQNMATYLPYIGRDVVYNNSPSHNVAHWNLKREDRIVEKILEGYDDMQVICDDTSYPLLSFHFSAKGINNLHIYGSAVRELRDNYRKLITCHNSN